MGIFCGTLYLCITENENEHKEVRKLELKNLNYFEVVVSVKTKCVEKYCTLII